MEKFLFVPRNEVAPQFLAKIAASTSVVQDNFFLICGGLRGVKPKNIHFWKNFFPHKIKLCGIQKVLKRIIFRFEKLACPKTDFIF